MGLELRGTVVLRDFRSSDRDEFVALAHDDAMFEYMKFRLKEATAPQYLDFFVAASQTTPRSRWDLVIESPDGEFAGWAGLGPWHGDGDAEFGWYLSSRHWGRGYATEAARLLIGFASDTLGCHKLFATADPANAASRRVLEKSGLSYVGAAGDVDTWRGKRPRVMYEMVLDTAM